MSRSRIALVSVAVVALAAGAYYLGRTGKGPAVPDHPARPDYELVGSLAVESSSLDLGEVWEEPEHVHTLILRNRGPREVNVTDVVTSCSCVSVRPRSFTVPPGGSVQLAVTLDLTKRDPGDLGQAVRPFAAEVYPTTPGTRAAGERASWTIAGRVKSRITLDALALHFGERPIYGEPAEPRTLTAAVHVPAREVRVTTADAGLTANVQLLDSAGQRYTVALTPDTKALTPGSFKTTVTVSVVTPSGETLFGARLPVEGVVRPEASLLPARLILGPRPVGATATGTLVLQGAGAKDVAVQQIETDSPDVTIAPADVDGAAGGRAYRVTQRVTKPGDRTSTARFTFTKAGRQITATVVISCFGEENPAAGGRADRAGEGQP
jgi:hypothetical protein